MQDESSFGLDTLCCNKACLQRVEDCRCVYMIDCSKGKWPAPRRASSGLAWSQHRNFIPTLAGLMPGAGCCSKHQDATEPPKQG